MKLENIHFSLQLTETNQTELTTYKFPEKEEKTMTNSLYLNQSKTSCQNLSGTKQGLPYT